MSKFKQWCRRWTSDEQNLFGLVLCPEVCVVRPSLVCHIQMTNIMLDGQQRELALEPSLWFSSQYLKHPFSEGGKLDKSLEEVVLLLVML